MNTLSLHPALKQYIRPPTYTPSATPEPPYGGTGECPNDLHNVECNEILAQFNDTGLETLRKILQNNNMQDLQNCLDRVADTYADLKTLQFAAKATENKKLNGRGDMGQELETNSVFTKDSSLISDIDNGSGWSPEQKESFLPSGNDPITISKQLSPEALSILNISKNPLQGLSSPQTSTTITNNLTTLLLAGNILCTRFIPSRSICVVNISPTLTVKIHISGENLDHLDLIEYIRGQNRNIPVSETHGVLRIGSRAYVFMRHIPGKTLHESWPALEDKQRMHISGKLSEILSSLREIEYVPGAPMGWNGMVKDWRQITRVGYKIHSETEFNDFLLFNPPKSISRSESSRLKALLSTPHRIVLSHGDFHPGNIMIDPDSLEVVAVIDWEFGGWYPEYWEFVKAMEPGPWEDWWQWFPRCTAGYEREWGVDMVLDRVLGYGVVGTVEMMIGY
ncbi:APH-domain-containing protein [Choiromyces venosus 120613-1]|uniref:APH-domain-containing protein n=1 Tax=Choiromyces venosus 120613-1 TaxID=1336337 RepID=A0A3N4J8X0_9PEZI|nr:APH-domain-containing protein [Choiromyces venosus 120613-1]